MNHTGQGFFLILALSMPAVLTAAAVGLVVGIIQAVTQVQEQTITAAPKIVLVFVLLIFGGPLMMKTLEDYLNESIRLATEVVPQQTLMVMPPKITEDSDQAALKADFFKEEKRLNKGSKLQQFINAPASGKDLTIREGAEVNLGVKQQPKLGVGEKVFLNRRQKGTLPPPPPPEDQ